MNEVEIIILGCGPAAAVAAIHLQRLGHQVMLAGELRRKSAFEGLAPRVMEGISRAGLVHARASVSGAADRTAIWNGDSNAANREYLVDRETFDRALLQDCDDAGVMILRGRIGNTTLQGDLWHIRMTTAEGSQTIVARFLVEARGRRAPHHGKIALRGPRSLSLARRHTGVPKGSPKTFLASYADGWSWFASTGDGVAVAQIVISGNSQNMGGKADIETLYQTELAKLPDIHALLGPTAVAVGPVIARECSAILNGGLLSHNALRVGDAAFAIDPLSGHGNFEAIGGAMAAAAVINTLIRKPENRHLATRFYEERATTAFMRHARVGRDFYRMESRWPERPFWTERRDWPDDAPAHEAVGSAATRLGLMPVIEHGFVEEREVIITPDQPRGIRMLDDVPVAALLARLRQADPIPPIAALAIEFDVTHRQIASALGWLRYRGLLPQESLRSAP